MLAMIQEGAESRSVGDASIGTLYVDLSFERNAPCSVEDARGLFSSRGIEFDDESAEWLAETLTPVVFAPKGTPSYVYLIASLDDAGFVNWGTFATRADLDRAWAECEERGRRFETCED